MVHNEFVKCDVCGKVFRLRWQIGYSQAFVKTLCPNCKNHFEIVLNAENKSKYCNVSVVDYGKNVADYLIEVSTEFLTKKIQQDYNQLEKNDFLTPFMRNVDIARESISRILSYANNLDGIKSEVNSILSMLNNNSKYLKQTLYKSSYFKNISMKHGFTNVSSDLDALVISHQYIVNMIGQTFLPNTFESLKDINQSIMGTIKVCDFNNFLQLLSDNNIFEDINKKFSSIVSDILNMFIKLIPVYLRYDLSYINLNEFGINTVDVGEILVAYKKCYEFIGEFCIIPIGLNNIVERGGCDNFKEKTENIYDSLNKIDSRYTRLNNYLLQGEKFTHLFNNILNNIIRNSEAHFDYTFDPISQNITFKDKQKTFNFYLVEMVKEFLNIYQRSVFIWEMNYCLNKLYLIRIKGELVSLNFDNKKAE